MCHAPSTPFTLLHIPHTITASARTGSLLARRRRLAAARPQWGKTPNLRVSRYASTSRRATPHPIQVERWKKDNTTTNLITMWLLIRRLCSAAFVLSVVVSRSVVFLVLSGILHITIEVLSP